MDDDKKAGEGASSESQPPSVGKLIDAAVDTSGVGQRQVEKSREAKASCVHNKSEKVFKES